MDTNLKLETPLTEDEARAKYTKALTAFNAKCNTIEALRQELEEESIELTRLKGEVDCYSGAFLRAVERQELDRKDDLPEAYHKADEVAEAKDKAESRTIGKILGKTEDAPAVRKPHSEETKPPIEVVPDEPAYATMAEVQEEAAAYARKLTGIDQPMDVTETDRDEAALAMPSPGQRRAENIQPLSPEREAQAEDILKTVDDILSDD